MIIHQKMYANRNNENTKARLKLVGEIRESEFKDFVEFHKLIIKNNVIFCRYFLYKINILYIHTHAQLDYYRGMPSIYFYKSKMKILI